MTRARHLDCSPDTKRKSGQAALDSSTSIDSPGSSPRRPKVFSNGRPVKPMPKRARLQPTTAGPTAQKPPAPTTTPRFADPEAVVRPSDSFSSPSSFPSSSSASASAPTYVASVTNRLSALTHSSPSTTAARRTRVARSRYATFSSDSNESDGHSDVDDFVPHRTRSRTTYPRLVDRTSPPTPTFMRIVRQQSSIAR